MTQLDSDRYVDQFWVSQSDDIAFIVSECERRGIDWRKKRRGCLSVSVKTIPDFRPTDDPWVHFVVLAPFDLATHRLAELWRSEARV